MAENWSDWVGSSETVTDLVTPAAVRRFRATIDAEGPAGDCVPQGFHWCLCLPDAPTDRLFVDGHFRRGGYMPPIETSGRMWASSEVTFLTPIPVGAAIERVSTVAEIKEKSGSAGPLVFVEVDHVTTANGVPAVRERQTIVFREATGAAAPAPTAAEPDLSAWEWHRRIVPSEPLLFRYSALTFNSHRIHYDQPYATGVEGYPGLVVHGPLMATLLLDLCERRLGPDALATFRFRGQSPAFAGDPLHLVARREDAGLTLAVLGGDGRTVMTASATIGAPR